MRAVALVLATVSFFIGATAALADDWTAVKLRGQVLQLVDGDWQPLLRGEVVPDDRVLRTLNGRLTLVRGAEVIELGANTQVQVFDKESRLPFTTVRQHFGEVAIEAEVREVNHFAVQTPHLVAVVKGTRFVVRSGRNGSAVAVRRGAVAVNDRESGQSTLVQAGQSATTRGGTLEVAGRGKLPDIVDAKGKPVDAEKSGPGAKGKGKGKAGENGKPGSHGKAGGTGNANGNNGNGNGNGQGRKKGKGGS